MNRVNNKGYILIEVLATLLISGIICGVGLNLFTQCAKEWSKGISNYDIIYNCRHSINKLYDEARDSCGAEILDFSDNGWVKLYRSEDENEFITFRMKNNKLFIGYNNVLNSNSEFSNFVDSFKVEYIPNNVDNYKDATGINIFLKYKKDSKIFDTNIKVAFRY